MDLACAFLRPQGGTAVRRIVSSGNRQEVRLQIRGYRITPPRMNPEAVAEAEREGSDIAPKDVATGDALDISEDLFRKLRGGRHLVFANRRADVELYSDLLRAPFGATPRSERILLHSTGAWTRRCAKTQRLP